MNDVMMTSQDILGQEAGYTECVDFVYSIYGFLGMI